MERVRSDKSTGTEKIPRKTLEGGFRQGIALLIHEFIHNKEAIFCFYKIGSTDRFLLWGSLYWLHAL